MTKATAEPAGGRRVGAIPPGNASIVAHGSCRGRAVVNLGRLAQRLLAYCENWSHRGESVRFSCWRLLTGGRETGYGMGDGARSIPSSSTGGRVPGWRRAAGQGQKTHAAPVDGATTIGIMLA